jgi:glutathione S-transferase
MHELTLVIGNKNYSSWSLRPWILMKRLGLEFGEVQLRLDTPEFKDEVARYAPHGRVPVLRHRDLAVARSVCAEMHSGFLDLRMQWPMNARARNRRTAVTPGLEADVDRIDEIWMDCRRRFGASGPWLFGDYSIADAMYAPVVLRFNTYRAQVSDTARWYIATALADSALQEWVLAAQEEPWTPASA